MDTPKYTPADLQSWVKDPSKLPPGYWIDPGLPDPLHTKADVDEVFAMVEKLVAKRNFLR